MENKILTNEILEETDVTNSCDNDLTSLKEDILEMIKSPKYTHHQKVFNLANLADRLLDVLNLPENLNFFIDKGVICDLGEGHAPLRPRYICPDYKILFEKGCSFLRLAPPTTLKEALHTLMIFYHHVPSVTNFPVYMGQLDDLLEPFVKQVSREEAKEELRWFLKHVDRTITDSFCHANIGPHASITAELILELEEELEHAVPNMTFKLDPSVSPKDLVLKAIKTQLKVAKPSFCNHKMFCEDLGGEDYCIASCYNGLKIGGGAYTLVRMRLGHLAKLAKNQQEFFDFTLPLAMDTMQAYMDERIRFMVEESGFFENNFLVKEGFITRDKFSAMFGLVGLAECVNDLLSKEGLTSERYGHSEVAKNLGIKIMEAMKDKVLLHKNKYCEFSCENFLLHGQVGTADIDETASTRIPIGEEPKFLADHLRFQANFDHFFPSGTGEIIKVEETASQNPLFVYDILKGAFSLGCRYLSIHNSDSDIIRVTGYLAKRSDMQKFDEGKAVLQDTTHYALGAAKNSRILERKHR